MGLFSSIGKAVKGVAKGVSSFISPITQGIGAVGSLVSGASNLYSAINPPDVPQYDYKKAMQANKASQMEAQRIRRQDKYMDAQKFKDYAKMMGVSRYALLGNAPSSSVAATPVSPALDYGKPDRAKYFGKAGQDMMRGVNLLEGLKNTASITKLNEAQARLYGAQADALVNQTQRAPSITEENLPSDWDTYRTQIKDRGGALEDQPTLTLNNVIRHYPSQEIMDLISESQLAAGLYVKGKLDYAKAMNKAHNMKRADRHKDTLYNAYLKDKNRLSYIFGGRVYWKQTSEYTGTWKLKR